MATEHGCSEIYIHGTLGKRDAREEFIKALGVGRDVTAYVPRLDVLLRSKSELPSKLKPTRDAAVTLSAIAAKAHELVEGATGITSGLSQEWQNRVSWLMSRASGGSPKNIEAQRAHGKRGGDLSAAASVSRKWKRRSMRDQLAAAGRIWRDPIYRTREEARAALPEDLRALSIVTLWRLFKGRTVKTKLKSR